jgi:hypothetical protein
MAFKRASREDVPEREEGEGAEYFNLRNYKGQILAFEVLRDDPEYVNRFKEERPAVRVNVTIVTGQDRGVVWEKEWIEASLVYKTLRQFVGDTYVARITKGDKAFFINEIEDDEWEDAQDLLAGGGGPRMAQGPPPAEASDDQPPF